MAQQVMAPAGTTKKLMDAAREAGFTGARHDGRWLKFDLELGGRRYQATAMIFDEPSEFGIGGTGVSKLHLKLDGRCVFAYDRGLDVCDDAHVEAAARAALAFVDGTTELDVLAVIYTGQQDFGALLDATRMVPILNMRDGHARRLAEAYDEAQNTRRSPKRAVNAAR